MDLSKFKDFFVQEATEHVENLEKKLLRLEKNLDDQDLLDSLMRSSHTIKGSSATMGYVKMSFLTHVMEDIFDYARNGMIKITPDIIDNIFKAVDEIKKSLKQIQKSGKEKNVDDVTKMIKEQTGVETSGFGKSKRGPDGKPIVSKKKVTAKPKTKKVTAAPEKITEEVSEELNEELSHVKVSVHRLDLMMDLMEELLIDKLKLQNEIDKVVQNYKSITDIELKKQYPLLPKLKPLIDHLDRLTSEMQYNIMQSRLVPVDQVFLRFPRMVRDLAKKQNKKINFEMKGGDIELDRTILNKLAEPLVHLLRNAIDHGISGSGNIALQALREKENAIIVVENDSNSIDWKKVVNVAMKRNIISHDQETAFARSIEEGGSIPRQVRDLIFHPRLSTKEEVTETSGRGVGLSVVADFAKQLRGTVIVDSPLQGGGTRFSLELPLSLAIIKVLMIKIAGEVYAVPFSNIVRSVLVKNDNIKSFADQDVAVVAGQDIPLVYIENIFGIKKEEDKDSGTAASRQVIIVQSGQDIGGLVVDDLIDELEIIVKPLPPVLANSESFSGSTILGDGKTILIIDIGGLLSDAAKLNRFA